ncbi:hypothetical protein RUM43_012556 [Polyplax serrata]|uniref:Uncharacterized protein n=1 Tax=Polyplax serrata TaxID=468196 RepID=A0AAN8NSG2_POLSC
MLGPTVSVLLLQVLGAFFLVEGMELGDMIPLCAANDPDLNNCAKESAQKLIPQITRGVPLLKIPPLDPMVSPEIKLSEDDEKIKIDISYTDVTQLGLSQTKVDSALIDLSKGMMMFNFTFPVLDFSGHYVADGHIFNFQMKGEGKSDIKIENAKSDLIINFHVENDRIKEDDVTFDYNFDKIFLNFDHVQFQGDEELGFPQPILIQFQ